MPRRAEHSHLVDGEHVEVRDVVLLGQLYPGAALFLVDQLADVLVDKLALSEENAEGKMKGIQFTDNKTTYFYPFI